MNEKEKINNHRILELSIINIPLALHWHMIYPIPGSCFPMLFHSFKTDPFIHCYMVRVMLIIDDLLKVKSQKYWTPRKNNNGKFLNKNSKRKVPNQNFNGKSIIKWQNQKHQTCICSLSNLGFMVFDGWMYH